MAVHLLLIVTLLSFISSIQSDTIKINDFLFSGGVEFLDLTHPFDNNTMSWPGLRKFEFTKKFAGTKRGIWYAENEFCVAEHGGTHIDAPFHFGETKWTLGQMPFDHLITPLIVIDLSTMVAGNPDFVLQRHHMDYLFVGDPKRNFTVIFKFGWSQYYGNPSKYFGTHRPTENNLRFPGISEDVAKWLTETKTLIGVGVDTASIDPGAEHGLFAHKVLASHNIFILENVKIDHTMPSNQCAVFIMPMKIQDGTGAPCRITALCPRLSANRLF